MLAPPVLAEVGTVVAAAPGLVESAAVRKPPHVGLLINNAGQWVNGSEQNGMFVIEMLQNLGIPCVLYTHTGREGMSGLSRSNDFHGTPLLPVDQADLSAVTTFIMMCHIVDDGSQVAVLLRERLQGKKVIQFHCGQHMLFNAEDIVFNKHNVVRLLFNSWFTESWVFQMHWMGHEYYEALTGKPCKLMPYAWSPTLIAKYIVENGLNVSCDPAAYASGALDLCCFEPNLNVTKTCMVPLLIMNEFYARHPSRVGKCFVFCARQLLEHKSFMDFLAFLPLARDRKIEFYPRMPFPEILKQFKERDMRPVLIGHQAHNDMNYLSLEALHLGYPLVHNSNSIDTAGEFYDGWKVHDGTKALETVSAHFHEREYNSAYNERSRAVLRACHPSNPVILQELRALIV